jgi:phosphate-selective porin OprO/OprP
MTTRLARRIARSGLLILVFALLPVAVNAQDSEPEKILIRDVRLIDMEGQAEPVSVNLLIENAKLKIVTMDEIELEAGLIGFDAANGIVMGALGIGQPANFLIIDQDPREDVSVLLDTATHVLFAIREGEIIKNELQPIDPLESEEEEEEGQTRWIAYAPPPMALPISYLDTSKWNRWDTKYISGIFVAAIALDRVHWLAQDDNSEDQVGDLQKYSSGEIRALRFGAAGTLNFERPWFYQFMVATHAFDRGYDSEQSDDVTLLDYRLDIPLPRGLTLSVGKQKEPISMDRLLLGTQMSMTERAAMLDAMFQIRNVGVTVSGTGFDGRMSWAGGIYNDWFDNSERFSESSNQVTGRVSGLAYVSNDESHLLHLGLGARYNDARELLQYRAPAEFGRSPMYVDTGPFEAESTLTYDLEVAWRLGPYWLAAELVRNEVDSPDLHDPVFSGYQVTGSWILTREMRDYVRRNGTFAAVPVSRAVNQGGPGAWEVSARYSSVDLSDGRLDGGEMDVVSLALNWYPLPTSTVNLNYRHIILDRFGIRGHSDGLMARLILMLE